MTIVLVLGALIGAVMGLTGAGGGILAVPVLLMGLDWPLTLVMPVALLAVSGTATLGTLLGLVRGIVRYRAALLMAVAGLPAAIIGVWIGHLIPGRLLNAALALLILLLACRQLYLCKLGARVTEHADGSAVGKVYCPLDPRTGRIYWSITSAAMLTLVGVGTGFLTGLFGVGGGFFMVPALRRVSDIPIQGVAATALMVTALITSGTIVITLAQGMSMPLAIALPFAASTATGLVVGHLFSHRLSTQHLQWGFAFLLFVVGLLLAGQTFVLNGWTSQ